MYTSYKDHRLLAWLMWLLTISFFAYQFVLRIAPGLIINDIRQKFNIDAADYGMLSAMYYYGYAGMQIPVALLLDRYGPRIVGFTCALVCALSSLVFVYSDSWLLLLICRFLIGAASAAAFLNVSKVISMWFDPKFYGRMVGITFSLGLMGAVYGGRPMSSLIGVFGWSNVLLYVGILGIIISLFILAFVRNVSTFVEANDEHVLKKLKKICTNWKLVALAIANLLMVGALEGFADVWGVSYLVKVYSYSQADAAFVSSLIFVGMIAGGPLLAYIAEKMDIHYMLTAFCGIGIATIFFLIILLQTIIPITVLYIMMLLVGVFCCYQVLVFTIGSMMMEAYLISLTIAFLNCINMLGGSFFHTIIGGIMDYFWKGEMQGTLRIYDMDSYNYSLLSIPICAVIGSLIFIVVRLKSVVNTNDSSKDIEVVGVS